MQSNTLRIIAAVVDTQHLVLYKENGETMTIPQGDVRIRPILDTVVPLLVKQGYAEINLEAFTPQSGYAQFEEASNGVVKLFRIAKNKLKGLFGKQEAPTEPPVVALTVGTLPYVKEETAALQAVTEILEHAVPVTSPQFNEMGILAQGNVVETTGHTIKDHSPDEAADTIIAVVDNKVIPGMEKIKSQFNRAVSSGSTKGMEAFLSRLGAVINNRSHSVEDLLKFMERGDLPVADDGCILIYKVLRLKDREKRTFVDCHTSKVEQWVGCYVCMDSSLVDPNRNNECSNGLHVARRGYVREFNGNVCVLAKVAPEDVIAVPAYDANKMRVCGYHIIAELSPEQYGLVRANQPITNDPAGKILLGQALAGQHIHRTHEVRLTEQNGGGVQVKSLDAVKPAKAKKVIPTEALADTVGEKKAAPVLPKDVAVQVEQLSRKEKAAKLYADYQMCDNFPTARAEALEALMAYKKSAKVSWEKLGLPDLTELAKGVPVEVVVTPVKETKPETKKVKAPDTKRVVNDVVLGEGSPKERIQKLLSIGLTSVGVAKAILDLKKKSKKSWSILGVTDTEAEQILKLAGK